MLLRRVVLLSVFTGVVGTADGVSLAKTLLALLVAGFMIIQFVVRPYKTTLNNYLETFGLTFLLLLIAVNSQDLKPVTQGIISVVVLVIAACVLLSPLLLGVARKLHTVVRSRVASLSAKSTKSRTRATTHTADEMELSLIAATGADSKPADSLTEHLLQV